MPPESFSLETQRHLDAEGLCGEEQILAQDMGGHDLTDFLSFKFEAKFTASNRLSLRNFWPTDFISRLNQGGYDLVPSSGRQFSHVMYFLLPHPRIRLVYGGSATSSFTTYEVGIGQSKNNPKTFLNLKITRPIGPDSNIDDRRKHFGRIIFQTEDVDKLYSI